VFWVFQWKESHAIQEGFIVGKWGEYVGKDGEDEEDHDDDKTKDGQSIFEKTPHGILEQGTVLEGILLDK